MLGVEHFLLRILGSYDRGQQGIRKSYTVRLAEIMLVETVNFDDFKSDWDHTKQGDTAIRSNLFCLLSNPCQ